MIYRNRHNAPLRQAIPAVYMRGGSSKAVFFHEEDIPPPGTERDELLKRVMGTPDPLQIDGMGGTKAVTSKVAIIKRSEREDADVDYTFAQVGVNDAAVGYDANCGNISSAVGPFSIEEGLVDEYRKGASIDPEVMTQAVRIYNTNTEKVLTSHVPIDECGAPIEKGKYEMAAVPGTGAPILMDYVGTIGAKFGKGVLPTGKAIDIVKLNDKDVKLTICDVGNPVVFFMAEDAGMTGHESAEDLTENEDLLKVIDNIRGKGAELVGLCDDWTKVNEQSPFLPLPIAIAKPKDKKAHIEGRLFLDHMCHESMAGSGAICTAACSRVPGTLVYEFLRNHALEEDILQIAHPVGIMPVSVKIKEQTDSEGEIPEFETLSFIRTARRIMEGRLLIPEE